MKDEIKSFLGEFVKPLIKKSLSTLTGETIKGKLRRDSRMQAWQDRYEFEEWKKEQRKKKETDEV